MTAAALARRVAADPSALAVIANGARIDTAAFARAVAGAAAVLGALGLGKGASVAIQHDDSYRHLCLMLACEVVGLVSVSYGLGELAAPKPLALLGQVDLVLTEKPDRAAGARAILGLDGAWFARAAGKAAPLVQIAGAPGDAMRIQRSSGTTGESKRVLLRRAVREARIASWQAIDEIAQGQRSLIRLRPTFGNFYWQAALALGAGAVIVFENRVSVAEALALHAIDRVAMMPLQLRELLERLPPGFARRPGLAITTIGGRVAPALRHAALERVAGRVREVYSGNEAGNIAVLEADADAAIGTLCPGVEVEIVDAEGRVLPYGAPGSIRVRTPYMADFYLDDPEATARLFRDGWFHAGDRGVLHAPGRLEVIGRDDDLLNLGGHKVAPAELEETIRAHARLADVGVCTIPDAKGIEQTWIACVYDAPDAGDLARRLAPALKAYPFGPVRAVKLAAIPRTDTGKIKRAALKEAIALAAKR